MTEGATGEPLRAVRILLRNREGEVVRGTDSDVEGAFSVAALAPGTYSLEADRFGFARQTVTGLQLEESTELVVGLVLRRVALSTEGLVVTAGRRAERIADADVSVAVLGGDRIREAGAPTVFGALARMGGLDFFEAGLGHQQVSARGFVNPFSTNLLILIDHRLAALPGLGTLLPGMVTATQEELARVEVVTGPSSALYGANAGNGVLNLLTRGPLEGAGHSLRVGAGERGLLRGAARSAGRLHHRLGYTFSVEVQRAREFERVNTFSGLDGFTIQDEPDFDVRHRTVTGSLHFEPTPGRRVVYSGGVTEADYINLTVVSRLQVRGWEARFHQLRGHFDDLPGGGSLFVQGYHTRNDAGDSHYLDILARSRIPPEHGGPGLGPEEARRRATFVDRADRFDLEVQHVTPLGNAHTLTTGAQWRRTRPDSDGTYLADGPAGEAIRFDETGVYAGLESASISGLRLTLVGRFDHHGDVGSRVSPKVGAAWTLREGHVLRGSYNRAFNSPVTFLLHARSVVGVTPSGLPIVVRGNRDGIRFVNVAGGEVPEAIPGLAPLDVRSVELGYRGRIGRRLGLEGSVHRTVYSNYISKESTVSRPADGVFVLDPDSGEPRFEVTRTYLNFGVLPVHGVDLRGQWLFREGWSASANLSHQRPGDFRRPVPGVDPPTFNAPERSYRAGVEWRGGYGDGSHAGLFLRRVAAYEFESSLPYLTGTVPTHQVVDLLVGLPLPPPLPGRTRVDLSVRNLLDHRHVQVPGGAELGRLASIGFSWEW